MPRRLLATTYIACLCRILSWDMHICCFGFDLHHVNAQWWNPKVKMKTQVASEIYRFGMPLCFDPFMCLHPRFYVENWKLYLPIPWFELEFVWLKCKRRNFLPQQVRSLRIVAAALVLPFSLLKHLFSNVDETGLFFFLGSWGSGLVWLFLWVCLYVGWWAIVHVYCNLKVEVCGISVGRNNVL